MMGLPNVRWYSLYNRSWTDNFYKAPQRVPSMCNSSSIFFFFVTATVVKGRAQRKSSEARLTLFVKVKKFAGNGDKEIKQKRVSLANTHRRDC